MLQYFEKGAILISGKGFPKTKTNIKNRNNQSCTEATMYYADFNEELTSSYSRDTISFASLVSQTQLPKLGLKARTLLDEKQMKKLHEIRSRHLKGEQKASFPQD
jgi:hypothetical protein